MENELNILTILGHTAAGKTKLAANAALALNGEVISADSRQVYRGMDIGTGKDYADYKIGDQDVKYHLIDIVDAGEEYNLFEFQKDFRTVAEGLHRKEKVPVLCGGTGMYIESILRNYRMTMVPYNHSLRSQLENKSLEELEKILIMYKQPHNQSDSSNKKRALRAIEIAEYMSKNPRLLNEDFKVDSVTIGIKFPREERRNRITERLRQRLDEGLIDEVNGLLNQGVTFEKLEYYGLEYKYLSYYLSGKISFDDMFARLNTAIHQFSKRQMTYFRGMERRGIHINWLDGRMHFEEKAKAIIEQWRR